MGRSTRFIVRDKENLGTSSQQKNAEIPIFYHRKPNPIVKPKVNIKKLTPGGGSCAQHALSALDQTTCSGPNMP